MSDQEADLNDIYEELIKLKDTLDKIEDTCQNIIDYDLNKKPSIFDNNINEIKEALEELGVIHIRDHENIELSNDYTSQIHCLEHELSSYNKQIESLWYTYVLHPRLLKKNLTAEKNGQPCLKNKDWKLISKNTCITIKASQLLKFYYEKKQRLKEIYETYKDQEHIEELLKDIDEEDINTIWEHEEEDFIKQIEEDYNTIWEHKEKDFIKQIEEKDEIIELLKKRLQTANDNLVLLENENKGLLEKNQITNTKPVETANLLDIEYNSQSDDTGAFVHLADSEDAMIAQAIALSLDIATEDNSHRGRNHKATSKRACVARAAETRRADWRQGGDWKKQTEKSRQSTEYNPFDNLT